MATSKIKVLTPRSYQGKPQSPEITLEDGTSGYLQKESDTGLQVGDGVEYTVEDYTSKKGTKSKLITAHRLVATATQPTVVGTQPPPATKEQKQTIGTGHNYQANASFEAMKLVMDAFVADKITWDKIKEKHLEVTQWIVDGIDACCS